MSYRRLYEIRKTTAYTEVYTVEATSMQGAVRQYDNRGRYVELVRIEKSEPVPVVGLCDDDRALDVELYVGRHIKAASPAEGGD